MGASSTEERGQTYLVKELVLREVPDVPRRLRRRQTQK